MLHTGGGWGDFLLQKCVKQFAKQSVKKSATQTQLIIIVKNNVKKHNNKSDNMK